MFEVMLEFICKTNTEFLWGQNFKILKYMWISSNEAVETGAYYTEWSKPERKTPIQYTNYFFLKWPEKIKSLNSTLKFKEINQSFWFFQLSCMDMRVAP